MLSNETLQKNVQEAIKWEPLLHAAEIGVVVHEGVVTLTGTVNSYLKKIEVEKATKSVAGVVAVIEKIEVCYINSSFKDDTQIVSEVLSSLMLNNEIPKDQIKIEVEKGWVTLEGILNWNYQKDAAKRVVDRIAGVKGVTNNILVKTETKDLVERLDIEKAFARNWAIDINDIEVSVYHNTVTLIGKVDSWYIRDLAEQFAWKARGVCEVDNKLEVEYHVTHSL